MAIGYQEFIVSAIGEIGRSQVMIVIVSKLGVTIVAFAMVMMSFIATEPKWWKVVSIFNETSNNNFSKMYAKQCPTFENETVVFDTSIQTIVSEWELICSRKWIPSIIIMSQMIGVLVGVLINGQIGDWFGRRKTLLLNFFLLLLFLILQGYSVNWQMMAACIFFVGFASGAYLAVVSVYSIEFVGTSWRTVMTCCLPAWPLGVMLLGGSIKLFGNWRYVCFTDACVGFPILVFLWFCPESIRWLFVHGHTESGKNLIKRIAKVNKRVCPDLSGIDNLIQEFVDNEKRQIAAYNYFTIFKYKYTRWRVLLFGLMWFAMSISYYVIIFGVGSLHGDISLNMILMGLVQCFGVLVVWVLSKWFGRKYTSFVACTLSSLTCFGITIAYFTSTSSNFKTIQQVLAISSILCMASTWRSVMLHTLEIFPTVLRSIAISTTNMCARVGGLVAPQIAYLSQVSVHLPFTLVGIFMLLSAVCCLPLEDTYTTALDDYLNEEAGLINDKQSEGAENDENV